MSPQRRPEEYTVGWVCALPVELVAAQCMLDEEHEIPQVDARDTNIYTCGRIGKHNVVIATLPSGQLGTNSAAAVAVQMRSSFKKTRFGLMVGIGGGVPNEESDIRLGDVVISQPDETHGGVVQYDSGRATPSGFQRTGSLNAPPEILLSAVTNLRAKHIRGSYKLLEYYAKLNSLAQFRREAAGPDTLFEANYNHKGGVTCNKCEKKHLVARNLRSETVVAHYGTIASGNKVMRDAVERDRVSADLGGVLCFEMEAAGLMNTFPCLVIRGICDYADSHKNKKWQAYAAGTAATYAKEILSIIPTSELAKTETIEHRVKIYSTDEKWEFIMAKRSKEGCCLNCGNDEHWERDCYKRRVCGLCWGHTVTWCEHKVRCVSCESSLGQKIGSGLTCHTIARPNTGSSINGLSG